MKMRYLISLLVSLFCAGSALAEAEIPPSPIVKTALIIDAPLVKRGQPIRAGVAFSMPEHWHIYWQNPGDSGIPTSLRWTLPDGLKASDIQWPAPERISTQGIINYGYSNRVILPVTLTPGHDGVTGEVKVTANWLACRDICIPESAELTAMLLPNPEGGKQIAAAQVWVPRPFVGNTTFDATHDAVTLTITRQDPWGVMGDVRFTPREDGIMANDPPADMKKVGNDLILTFKRGTGSPSAEWHGVLHYSENGRAFAWEVTATSTQPVASTQAIADAPEARVPAPQAPIAPSFIAILLFAFMGGLILNIMPCVLPILALKALALAQKAHASRKAVLLQGISYTAGVILSFLVIVGVMLGLRATGNAIGWGFQLQDPVFVAFLAFVMVAVAANLFGLFELPVLFGAKATRIDDTKLSGSFFTGALAVLVATPCTAPFMASAIGATLLMPVAQALTVFAALGFGMASPFLLISFWPAARRIIPRPGKWMVRLKQLLAIPMLATAAWLIWVLVQLIHPTPVTMADGHMPYSTSVLAEYRKAGTPVFVDATASWCLTCKVNERVALKPEATQRLFREKNMVTMIADWTNADPEITKYLESFGRNGVPLYVYYPAHRAPVVLPQVLTPTIVREAIADADGSPLQP